MAQSANPARRAVPAAAGPAGVPLQPVGLRRAEGLPSGQRPGGSVSAGDECEAVSSVGRSTEHPAGGRGFFPPGDRGAGGGGRHFLPVAPGCFYIRPTLMGIDATLGVKSASEFVFFILTLPSGGYFKGV